MHLGMRKRTDNLLAHDQRLAYSINSAADALNCGRSSIYELIRAGKLAVIDINGMRRITGRSLRRLVGESEPQIDPE
jgi:excisionase family DNA binding protein